MIYFDIELTKRELLSRLLVAAKMAETGEVVYLGERLPPDTMKRLFGNLILVRKNCRLTSLEWIKSLVESHFWIINQDEEGVLIDDLEIYCSFDIPGPVLGLTKKVFLWGSAQREALVKKYPDYADRFLVTGNARVCLWKNRFFGLYDNTKMQLGRKYGSFVLFCSNFGRTTNAAFHARNTFLAIDEQTMPAFVDQIDAKYKEERIIFDAFISAAINISDRGIPVIFRCHPSDDVGFISKIFAGSRVQINTEGEVGPLLMAAQVMVHNCCTTGLEAFFLGTQVISFEPDGLLLHKENAIADLGQRCRSEADLVRLIESSRQPSRLEPEDLSLAGFVDIDRSLDLDFLVTQYLDLVSDFRTAGLDSKVRYPKSKWYFGALSRIRLVLATCKDFLLCNPTQRNENKSNRKKFDLSDSLDLQYVLKHLNETGIVTRELVLERIYLNSFRIRVK